MALSSKNSTQTGEEKDNSDPAVRTSSESVPTAVRPSSDLVTFTRNIPEEKSKRYLEILVHNVSHTDLVLSVDAPPEINESTYCLCAPRFSTFDMYCRRILDSLTGAGKRRQLSSIRTLGNISTLFHCYAKTLPTGTLANRPRAGPH
jgi:hypothetical protein